MPHGPHELRPATPAGTRRQVRARLAGELAAQHDGVVHRGQLGAAGITRHEVRTEVEAGRWAVAGRHTVVVGGSLQPGPRGVGRWWQAVWESGAGARLDGAAALLAHGLTGFQPDVVDVTVPHGTTRWHPVPGVRVTRRRDPGPVFPAGVPRTRVEWATIRAAQSAATDRQAALLICLPVQQRLVPTQRLLQTWQSVSYSPRRPLLDAVVRDVCDGAHSLGELDFGRWCRAFGIPAPDRQVVRSTPGGRCYVDCHWRDVGLTVEIDGGHHALALHPLDDALRQNDLVLMAELVLRIPVLGLRLSPRAFMVQVRRARELLAGRAA